MNACGLMILVFIDVGLAYHLISIRLFSMLVIVAAVTSAAAVPIYRLSVPTCLEDAERDMTTMLASTAVPACSR